ncbi:TetR/AcrR family transcriptional regulator [Streptomyces sp. NBC_00083]|uniref:TetR/AcrR family transcriptional regulator n=1 Tax=Streptomyces sp. NBC_00083 TaxID=2975647 RepID=UPI002259B359|nr:TetR/AcrR family transcriptional regulator [Streptomyces sp. NBC_00083]MCX5384451.1 TetR/AcrR family transcriptional regulator [Streptomyces sp. NBC_00083]
MTTSSESTRRSGKRRGVQHLTPAGVKILETASRLFYEQGIRAVGVEAIAEEAGVTKKTLYDRFGSKDDLIVAYLRARDGLWRSTLVTHVNSHDGPPTQKILSTFTALRDWMHERNLRGCAFINASVELPPNHPGREVAGDQKTWFLAFLEELAREADVQDPAALAAQVLILHEGATIAHSMQSVDRAVDRAEEMAAVLLERSRAERLATT